jgi:hypothetical protein
MIVRDKYGVTLAEKDWIRLCGWNIVTNKFFYEVVKIKELTHYGNVITDSKDSNLFSSNDCEKLPSNKKEREQILFLRKLEE